MSQIVWRHGEVGWWRPGAG